MVRCIPLDSDYRGISTLLVSFIEVLICVLSIAATWKHFKSAGRRLSNIAWFHLSHSGFCVAYATFNFILYYINIKICTCDPYMLLSCFYIACFLYMWVIFLKYWDITTRNKESINHHRAEVRVAIYSSITASYFGTVIYFTVYAEKCEDNSFDYIRSMIVYIEIICLILESSKIAYKTFCIFISHYLSYQTEDNGNNHDDDDDTRYTSLTDEIESNNNDNMLDTCENSSSFAQLSETVMIEDEQPNQSERIQNHRLSMNSSHLSSRITSNMNILYKHLYWELIQTLAFMSLPISLIIGFVMRAKIERNTFDESTYPIYLYLFPSIVMLCIMWQRHYITISGKTPQELEFDWMSDSEHESSYHGIRPSSLFIVPVEVQSHHRHGGGSGGGGGGYVPPPLPTSSSSTHVSNSNSSPMHVNVSQYNQRNRHDHYSLQNNNTFYEGFDIKSKINIELSDGLIQVYPLNSSFNFMNHDNNNGDSESSETSFNSENQQLHEDAFDNMFMPSTPIKGTYIGGVSGVGVSGKGVNVSEFKSDSLLPPSTDQKGNIHETSSSSFFASPSSIKVLEDLRPPYMFLSLSYHFMSSILLPSLEKALKIHNKRLKDLIEITSLNQSLNKSGESDHFKSTTTTRSNNNNTVNTDNDIVDKSGHVDTFSSGDGRHSNTIPNGNGVKLTNTNSLTRNSSKSLYCNLEMDHQHYELEKSCEELKLKFVKFVLELRDIINTMPLPQQHHYYSNMCEDIGYMKQSSQKKVPSLSYFTTNLQIHKTRLFYQLKSNLKQDIHDDDDNTRVVVDDDEDIKEENKELMNQNKGAEEEEDSSIKNEHENENENENEKEKKAVTTEKVSSSYNINNVEEHVISSITFGAPTAHSLGYKNGGLREMMLKLTSYYMPSEAKTSRLDFNDTNHSFNPFTLLKQLELRYECRAREAIVTSQALTAISSAALELLSRIIYKKENSNLLLLYSKVGLIVHCISLLSTSGHESAMLDDFQGALDRLDITLRFHPPDTVTYNGGGGGGGLHGKINKKKFTSSISSNVSGRSISSNKNKRGNNGYSSVDGGLRSDVSGRNASDSSVYSSIDSDKNVNGGSEMNRKTDPLNLLSVIKIKPTKIHTPSSTKETTPTDTTAATTTTTTNTATNDAAMGLGVTSSGLPPITGSALDSVFGESPIKSSKFDHDEVSSDKRDNRKAADEDDNDDEDKDEVNEKDDVIKSQEKSSSESPQQKKKKSVTKGVLLGRVTIDIQVNSLSSYEWLCKVLNIQITEISQAAASSIKKDNVTKKNKNKDYKVGKNEKIKNNENGEGFNQQHITQTIPTIKLIPVLFNLGVNEMQSIANVLPGHTSSIDMQTDINRKNLLKLSNYFNNSILIQNKLNNELKMKMKSEQSTTPVESSTNILHISSATTTTTTEESHTDNIKNTHHDDTIIPEISFFSEEDSNKIPLLLSSIEFLVEAVAKDKGKFVDLLLVSSFAARLLNGARTTSCKSAKDRTSVFHTLEVARLTERMGWLERSKEMEFLDALRGIEGVRLQNCVTNIGRPMYSFNSVQMKALPKELRPPASTASAGGQT